MCQSANSLDCGGAFSRTPSMAMLFIRSSISELRLVQFNRRSLTISPNGSKRWCVVTSVNDFERNTILYCYAYAEDSFVCIDFFHNGIIIATFSSLYFANQNSFSDDRSERALVPKAGTKNLMHCIQYMPVHKERTHHQASPALSEGIEDSWPCV